MTVVYVSVPITSVEQAEKLPVGTPVWDERPERRRVSVERGHVSTVFGKRMVDTDAARRFSDELLGWTALVPIEAEEETDTIETGEGYVFTRTNFVTPWEPVEKGA